MLSSFFRTIFDFERVYALALTSGGDYLTAGRKITVSNLHGFVVNRSGSKAAMFGPGAVVRSIQGTADGGAILAGSTGAAWLVRLNPAWRSQWEITLDGPRSDALAVRVTADGGFIAAGGDLGCAGDLWVAKLDASGVVKWRKTYG